MPKAPDVHGSAVGLAAVEMINLGDWYDEKAGRLQQSGDILGSNEAASAASRIYEKAPATLDKARDAISKVPDDPSYQAYFRSLLARASSSYNGRRADALEWLTNKDHGASDSELLDVFNQQLAVLAAQQRSPDVTRAIEAEKDRYTAAVHNGVSEGWLSKHSLFARRYIPYKGVCRRHMEY
jgi:formate dehydrogenase maturation protein FdhE